MLLYDILLLFVLYHTILVLYKDLLIIVTGGLLSTTFQAPQGAVFMDQKGSRYGEDMLKMELFP